jgi:hypothetical protein
LHAFSASDTFSSLDAFCFSSDLPNPQPASLWTFYWRRQVSQQWQHQRQKNQGQWQQTAEFEESGDDPNTNNAKESTSFKLTAAKRSNNSIVTVTPHTGPAALLHKQQHLGPPHEGAAMLIHKYQHEALIIIILKEALVQQQQQRK